MAQSRGVRGDIHSTIDQLEPEAVTLGQYLRARAAQEAEEASVRRAEAITAAFAKLRRGLGAVNHRNAEARP